MTYAREAFLDGREGRSVRAGRLMNDIGRTCSKCSTFKPWSEFSLAANQVTGRRPECHTCQRRSAKAYHRSIHPLPDGQEERVICGPESLESIHRRFWAKVVKAEFCWVWTGVRNRKGYGEFTMNGKKYLAQRAIWTMMNGVIPGGVCICHRCDNPSCVRPEHLFAGNYTDNNRDRDAKGRHGWRRHPELIPTGERTSRAVLTWDQVLTIRATYVPRVYTLRQLANEYGVTVSTIASIIGRRNWKERQLG